MNAPTTEEAVRLLINEVLILQTELLATRVVAVAALSGDPDGYLEAFVGNVDTLTLPLVMTEEQRELVRAQLDDCYARWTAMQRVLYPPGWHGVRSALFRACWRLRRIVRGAYPLTHREVA